MDGDEEKDLFLENCSSQSCNHDVNVVQPQISRKLRKLSINVTTHVLAADSLVIQKTEQVWRQKWNSYKHQCVNNGVWKDGDNCD